MVHKSNIVRWSLSVHLRRWSLTRPSIRALVPPASLLRALVIRVPPVVWSSGCPSHPPCAGPSASLLRALVPPRPSSCAGLPPRPSPCAGPSLVLLLRWSPPLPPPCAGPLRTVPPPALVHPRPSSCAGPSASLLLRCPSASLLPALVPPRPSSLRWSLRVLLPALVTRVPPPCAGPSARSSSVRWSLRLAPPPCAGPSASLLLLRCPSSLRWSLGGTHNHLRRSIRVLLTATVHYEYPHHCAGPYASLLPALVPPASLLTELVIIE
ncbi:hypothetical protein HNY73_020805 [Argiope bruennichi]|uniref:Uncharacterized protein n=1 Tax=Argiope bruennichi TaxID=94029 RepID=A0A8T0EAP9_ARGBR|nr:hypothetical protein HNY73_020805 [Argiope bruennichi]